MGWMGGMSTRPKTIMELNGGHSGSGRTALTFNLVDFSILLHYLSSPATHPKDQETGHSRPDIHGILSLLAPLLDVSSFLPTRHPNRHPLYQLTIYNTFGIAKRWSHHRLPPTALSFFIILFSQWLSVLRQSRSYFARSGLILASFDTLMLLSIFITWFLKALTCVLLNGGLGDSFWTLPASMTLRWEDDFRTILLKLILASFSTTSVSGFANELPSINAKAEASVEIAPDGTVLFSPGAKGGFGLEIKKVTVEEPEPSDPIFGGWGEAGRWRLLRKLGHALGNLALYLVRPLYRDAWAGIRSTLGLLKADAGNRAENIREQVVEKDAIEVRVCRRKVTQETNHFNLTQVDDEEEEEETNYQKFLRGWSVATEGDTDYVPRATVEPEDIDIDSDSDVEEPESSQSLFDPQDPSDAPILLSHFLSSQNHPMTRLRYRGVSRASPMTTPIGTPVKRTPVRDDEEKQVCIVCYSEPREIICWPCRCLSLCDDCRSSLATLPLNQHLCPTCRVPYVSLGLYTKPTILITLAF